MLTPQELLEIVDTLHPQLDTLNVWITKDLISRLMARLGRGEEFLLTGTDQWQLEVYKSAGGHYDALQQEIKRFTKKSDAEIRAIFEDAGIRAWEADEAFYVAHGLEPVSFMQSESMLRLLTDNIRQGYLRYVPSGESSPPLPSQCHNNHTRLSPCVPLRYRSAQSQAS